jgi:uncharacterized protein (TIGR00369 family)
MTMLDAIRRTLRGETVDGFRMNLAPPVAALIGLEAVQVDEGKAVFRLQARRDRHANPMGTLHGGILCDLADGAMGIACASTLEMGESFTTADLAIHFFRPVTDALLEARARVVHGGRSMVYLECEVVALPGEKLVAKASSTCFILRGAQAQGR